MVTSAYNPAQEEKSIWVYLETDAGSLAQVSLELIGRGRQLADETGWNLTGLLCGHSVAPLAQAAFRHGVERVILADHPILATFTVDAFCHVAGQVILAHLPSVFLLGATPNGRDLAGRLAVRLRTGLNADCLELNLDAARGVLICEVSGFGGGVLALIEMENHRPQMATVRPGVFQPGPDNHPGEGVLVHWPVKPGGFEQRTTIIERVVGDSIDLTQAPILVAGGRGIGERFDLLWELARQLGGDVGGTRPPVDEGYIERARQIGQTGVICRPKVALVFGASGAFHFVVGIQDADLVIAVNSDPEALIFEHADYGVVGDALEILHALTAALKRERDVSHA